ncbi:MAG: hypothetical protein DMF76_09380 [Acidobacteria bacterium]|nr:MAG: hypothetical protein DMF76_09380 [Acidobacteriota bacterium]
MEGVEIMADERKQNKGLNQQGGHQMPGRGQKEEQAAGSKRRDEDTGRQGSQWDEMGSIRRNQDYQRREQETRR